MKFRVTKEKLLEGLQLVQNVVSTRTTLPILSNVLLEASDGRLSLTTTDLDVGVSGKVEAEVLTGGEASLPARRLVNIIRELPASEIDVEIDAEHTAAIRSGPSFFKILGLSADEFPPLPQFADAREFTLPQKQLKDSLRRTSYAISTDETRYVLNGIFCRFSDNVLTIVATDGRRLAMVELDLEFPESHEGDIIIPTKAVMELQRLLKDEGELKLRVTDNQIAFELNDYVLVSKLIDGNYPNFRQVVPGDPNERVTIERETFLNTVHRVALLASDKSNSVKLVFGEDSMKVMANSPEIGEAEETISINYRGKAMAIAFNPEFLMAPLRNLDEDEIHLDLIDDISPGVIKINEPFLYVLMPMRVSS